MKILCVADTKDPLVYSENIVMRYGDVDLVLSCGDLPLSYYEFIISSLNKPFYFIFGNHHTEDLNKYLRPPWQNGLEFPKVGGTFLDGKVARDASTGLLLAGLGGSMRYNRGEHQFTNFQMYWRIFKVLPRLFFNRLRYGRYLDILLTHAPPHNLGDQEDLCHTGFKAFRWFMRHFKPALLLHGHIHLTDMNTERSRFYRETEVVNVYSSHLVEKEFENVEPR